MVCKPGASEFNSACSQTRHCSGNSSKQNTLSRLPNRTHLVSHKWNLGSHFYLPLFVAQETNRCKETAGDFLPVERVQPQQHGDEVP